MLQCARTSVAPGGAGTILNNLVALGVKQIFPVGFAVKMRGYELRRALAAKGRGNWIIF